MDTIRQHMDIEKFSLVPFDRYFGGLRFAAFDIETTGLAPGKCAVILSGFCEVDESGCTVTQYFAESLSEEAELLEATCAHLLDLDFVLTYNGHRFDMPFTYERAKKHNVNMDHDIYDLDLYKIVKRHSDIRSFTPNLRQTTLEDFMGLWADRTDTIDGGQSVTMYYDYLASREESLKRKILLHNSDDVLQLYRLLTVLSRCDIDAAMQDIGFPVILDGFDKYARCNSARIGRKSLHLEGNVPSNSGLLMPYIEPGVCEVSADGTIIIDVRLKQEQGLMLCDLDDIGISGRTFAHLGTYGSGFLALADEHGQNDMEINMLAAELIKDLCRKLV